MINLYEVRIEKLYYYFTFIAKFNFNFDTKSVCESLEYGLDLLTLQKM